jgi:hypothetical protein
MLIARPASFSDRPQDWRVHPQTRVQTDSKGPNTLSEVIYPSMATWLLTDNVAILPREVDTKLALFEVILFTLHSIKEVTRTTAVWKPRWQ